MAVDFKGVAGESAVVGGAGKFDEVASEEVDAVDVVARGDVVAGEEERVRDVSFGLDFGARVGVNVVAFGGGGDDEHLVSAVGLSRGVAFASVGGRNSGCVTQRQDRGGAEQNFGKNFEFFSHNTPYSTHYRLKKENC